MLSPAREVDMPTRWRIGALTVLVCALVGCSKDDPTGPKPEQITGAWTATRVEYVSVPPGTTVDLIALGGTATLTLAENSTFHYVVTPAAGSPTTTDGTWTLSGDMLNLTPQGMPFSWQFEATLSSGSLSMSGASVEYDFNHDSTPEQATLNLLFVR
jgi:hypothetical protein